MATKFFLRSGARDLAATQCPDERALDLTAGPALATTSVLTVASGNLCGNALFCNNATSRIRWVSNPVDAVTISGTITINLWMAESNMSANAGAAVGIWRVAGDGTFSELILGCRCDNVGTAGTGWEKGTELPVTTRAAQNWTGTPASVTLSAGDRLAAGVGISNVGAMGAGFSATLGYDDDVGAADGDSWVEFTETITEQAAAAPGPVFHRRDRGMDALLHFCRARRPVWRREHGVWLPGRELRLPTPIGGLA